MTTLEAIKSIISDREQRKITPTHPLIKDICNLTKKSREIVYAEIEELGYKIGRTINDEYVKV